MKHPMKYLQSLFHDLLNDYGRVYILVKYSENSTIGRRGFTEEEKKKGLILVFNQKNNKDIQWADDGSIITTLGFGVQNRTEKCFISSDDIVSVFSPDAKIKFDRWDVWSIENAPDEPEMSAKALSHNEKVVSMDRFKKKKMDE